MNYSNPIAVRQALDADLLTQAQLKAIHKHLNLYVTHDGTTTYGFGSDPILIHHLLIENQHYQIQLGVTRRGKVYHYAVFAKTADPNWPSGFRFTCVKKFGFEE